METTTFGNQTVGALVAEDYRRAAVLKRFGIDFCCGGGKTLAAACEKKGVSVEEVEQALQTADGRGQHAQARVNTWSPGFLADFIVNEHHSYVRETIPVLRFFTQKVARVHGGHRPELVEIAALFDEVATELEAHMASEETEVFQAIKAVAEGKPVASSRSLRDLIGTTEDEHDRAGELMRIIRRLSADYTPPEDACNTYRASFAKLEEFEDDLHRHVHLENNILFPKALALETAEEKVLDVRVIAPPQKHPLIFATFDALASGDHFILVNDHDPVPLRYQFEYTRTGQVGWEYLEEGPEVWRVKISRKQPVAA